jgi:hypothetical protein
VCDWKQFERGAVMKKNRVIVTIVFVTVIVFFAGQSLVKYYKNKSIVEDYKPTIEKFVRLNFSNVKSIQFDEIEDSPMALSVNGHINNNKDFDFTVILGDNEVYGLGYGQALRKYRIENSPRVLSKLK